MEAKILGIHQVSATAAAPQPNVDFYTSFPGIRLVTKVTNMLDSPSGLVSGYRYTSIRISS